MTTLPEYEERLTPVGEYEFTVNEEPEVRRSRSTDGQGKSRETLNVKVKFLLTAPNGRQLRHTDVFFIHEPRYRDFLSALGCKKGEDGRVHTPESFDIVGQSFVAEIVHESSKTDQSKIWARIANFKLAEDNDVPAPGDDIETPF